MDDLNSEEIVGTFYEKELLKANQTEFRTERVTKTKFDKLYVKWKGCDSYFNSWIDKKKYRYINTAQKMKFSIKNPYELMWPNPQFPADLVTLTEEILKEKLHFL